VPDLGATLVAFPNGALLNIKKTDFRDDQILIRATTGIGQLGLPTDRFSPLSLAGVVLSAGGLGKLNVDEINRVLAGHVFSTSYGQGGDSYSLGGSTRPEDLELTLQLMTAYLTDPGLRAAPLERMKAAYLQ
ncbi:hypothetical protein LTR94_033859, partial [Friedmanniomyces endolithicus]